MMKHKLHLLVPLALCFTLLAAAEQAPEPPEVQQIRLAILKRWPDASGIEIETLTPNLILAEAPAAEDLAPPTDPELNLPPREELAKEAVDGEVESVEACLITAAFKSGGHDFEVLFKPDGKGQFVNEDLPYDSVPEKIRTAALKVVAGEILFAEKSTDESMLIPVISFALTIDAKIVYVSPNGKVSAVEDVPDDDSHDSSDETARFDGPL
jgi:hypothetical protein